MTSLYVKIPNEIYEKLRKESFEKKLSLSEITKRALALYFTSPGIKEYTHEPYEE